MTRLCGQEEKSDSEAKPHVNRWRRHLQSFDEAERKAMMVQSGKSNSCTHVCFLLSMQSVAFV